MNLIVANCEVYNEAGAGIIFLARELVMRLHCIVRPGVVSSSSAFSAPASGLGESSSSSSARHAAVGFNDERGLVEEGVDEPLLFKLRVRRGKDAQQAMVDEADDSADAMLVDEGFQADNESADEAEDAGDDDDAEDEDEEEESSDDDDNKHRRARSQPSRKPNVRLTLSSVRASRAAAVAEAISPARPRRAAASKTVLREQSDDDDDAQFQSSGRKVRSSQRSSQRLRHHDSDDEQNDEEDDADTEKPVRPVRSTRTSSAKAVAQESVVEVPSRSTRRSSRLPASERVLPANDGDDDSEDEDKRGRAGVNRASSRSSRSHRQSIPTSPPPQSMPPPAYAAPVAPTARPQRLDREVKAHMYQLVAFVESLDTDKVFAYPVRAEEAPGYYDIVQTPMDLSTIQ